MAEAIPFYQQLILELISPAAILAAAFWAWRTQRRIAICRATIDFISKHEVGNREWREAKLVFAEVTSKSDHPKPLIALLAPKDAGQWENYLVVTSLLSHFEAVAVAIKHQTISEEIYKDWNKSAYVSAWKKAQSYVNERRERKRRDSIYRNFQDLAQKWDQEPDDRN